MGGFWFIRKNLNFSIMRFFIFSFFLFLSSLLLAQSNFEFSPSNPLPGSGYIFYPGYPSITTADLNGDNYPDLIVSGRYNQYYSSLYSLVFLYVPASGNYVFQDTLRDSNGQIIMGYEPTLEDIDFDDVPELFIKDYAFNSDKYFVYKYTSNGFILTDTLKDVNGNVLDLNRPPLFLDYDRDTARDIYFFKNAAFYVARNNKHGRFETPQTVYLNNGTFSFASLPTRADFYLYNDTVRLVVATQSSGVYLFKQTDYNKFEGGGYLTHFPNDQIFTGNFPEVVVDSISGKPLLDLLFVQANSTIWHYQYNLTYDSGFVFRNVIAADDYFISTSGNTQICFYDINHDGLKDLFLTDKNGYVLFSYNLSGAKAYFTLPDTITVNGQPLYLGDKASPAVADFNKDGKTDLLLATSDGSLHYYSQNSGTDFNDNGIVTKFDTTVTIVAGDINGDGTPQLLVSNKITGNLAVYNFDGSQLDSVAGIDYIGYRPVITLGDMNNDNHPDMVFAYADGTVDRLAIWLNDGNGNFANPNQGFTDISIGSLNTGIGVCDIDRDGRPDVVLGRFYGDTRVYLNKTSGASLVATYNENRLNIYPNPAFSTLFVSMDAGDITRIEIYSLQGRLIKTMKLYPASGIPLSDLKAGLYTLKVETRSGVITRKFLKL